MIEYVTNQANFRTSAAVIHCKAPLSIAMSRLNMHGILLNGALLESLIKSRFRSGKSDLISLWDASGEGLDQSTIYRWTKGQLPRKGDDLLKLAGLLDVDPFALLAFESESTTDIIERLLRSYLQNKWERFSFFSEFFGRQKNWPPLQVATQFFQRNWNQAMLTHDPARRANYYATISLTGHRHLDNLTPQVFHFAFRQPGRFAGHWLDYGFVVRTGKEVRLLHINGQAETYMANRLEEPTYVETFFGPSAVEFCIASLHSFSHNLNPEATDTDMRVRFHA